MAMLINQFTDIVFLLTNPYNTLSFIKTLNILENIITFNFVYNENIIF